MQVSTHNPVQSSWLTLLMVLVLCAGLASPAGFAESQQQGVELQSKELSSSAEDDNLIAGFMLDLITTGFPLSSLILIQRLSPVTGSDAYSSQILHAPPTPDYLV